MLFNSLEFGVFFAVVATLNFLLRRHHRPQNALLLIASYLFYAAWDVRFLSLILFSTLLDFIVGRRIAATEDPRLRRRWLLASLIGNLGVLGVFKYYDFFITSCAALLAQLGLEPNLPLLRVVLPVGISFYTFQTLSYTIDIYRRQLQPTRRLLDFALFVAFFPQLVAGPIERARRLLPQITNSRTLSAESFGSGCWLILSGLVKKVVIADNLAYIVDAVFADPASYAAPFAWLATYSFAVQIYCDFSGYSDIARGTARVLGFELMVNFRLPYFAASVQEFWRRWHISLSTWLRDYLYIPLGGNRSGGTDRNLMLTMLLGGLWHGAAWTFVLWGAWHGLLLIAHRHAAPLFSSWQRRWPRLWHGLGMLLTFHLVCFGWILFRADGLANFTAFLGIFTRFGEAPRLFWSTLPFVVLATPMFVYQVLQERSGQLELALRWPPWFRTLVYLALVLAIVLLGEDFGEQFLYFQF